MARQSFVQAPSAFLLTGEDETAKRARLEALIAERLDPESLAFNLDRLSARDADPSTVATLLETPPLLGATRVVVLGDAEAASSAVEQIVSGFLARPCPSTCLIVVAAGKLAGEPWTAFRRAGREEVFDPPRGTELKRRIRQEVEQAGKKIDDRAAGLLADLHREDPVALSTEIAKVVAHAGDRHEISAVDVEEVGVSSGAGDRYTFVDLVGMGRRAEAMRELRDLLERGESPIFLVSLLTQHFLLLGGIRACDARGARNAEEIAAALGKSAWILTKKNFRIRGYRPPRDQARRYDRQAIDRWLAGLLELDLALKSSRLPSSALVEEMVLRMMSRPAAA